MACEILDPFFFCFSFFATFSRRATPLEDVMRYVYSRQDLKPLNGKMQDARSVRHRRC